MFDFVVLCSVELFSFIENLQKMKYDRKMSKELTVQSVSGF